MSHKIQEQIIKPYMFRRLAMVLGGQVIMGLSVCMLRMAVLGTDPFSAMMLSLTKLTPLNYGTFCLLGNCVFFLVEILWGRQYIGFGTIANWFLLGYMVMFWEWVIGLAGISKPEGLPARVLLCLLAIIVLGFSLSLYQSGDIGSSPYDCLPLIIRDCTPIPFFAARVIVDGCSALIAYLTGGVIGLGTVLVFVGLGTSAGFFNKVIGWERFLK